MLTRRRDENCDQISNIGSPKRICVVNESVNQVNGSGGGSSITGVINVNGGGGSESDQEPQFSTRFSSHSYTIFDQGLSTDEYKLKETPLSEEECKYYRDAAQEKGTQNFIQEFIFEKNITIHKLFYAFDYRLPARIKNLPEKELLSILHKILAKFLRQRKKLPNINTLQDVIRLLSESSNIMVLTGAGVSVSCGIPDFRSENGIYSRLSEFDLEDPQDMFDINYFKDCPKVFYSFAKEIYPSNFLPSPSHYFIKLLEEKGKLLRNYSQNIDTLEQAAGIKNVLQCHGSFATASCLACGYRIDGGEIKDDILNQKVPYCPKCNLENDKSEFELRKKSISPSVMKPDIVFFGEKLPPEFDNYFPKDREKVDLLIVMGSSLKVAPVSEIMGQIPHRVPQIVINKTPIKHMQFDVQLLGDCDIIIPELCRMLDWELFHEKLSGGSSLKKPPVNYNFYEPNVYLFEGAIVKPKELSTLSVKPNIESILNSGHLLKNGIKSENNDKKLC
ncbi:22718_t:CDS:2 [Entrophospora sp. SA101]|nr:22718_t:CDS:2 [Entrophospora sp. SA101]CAJ0919642.1 1740_t:CDS:2 [Entrophospora sp. SA101]